MYNEIKCRTDKISVCKEKRRKIFGQDFSKKKRRCRQNLKEKVPPKRRYESNQKSLPCPG